jgi:hypothetical protein
MLGSVFWAAPGESYQALVFLISIQLNCIHDGVSASFEVLPKKNEAGHE